jgi:predicted O-methyltransferase YrrM
MRFSLRRAWRFVSAYAGMEKFKRLADTCLDQPANLVSLLFSYAGSCLRPFQIEEELASLVRDVRQLNPSTVLEIGTAQGGTLFLWTRLAQKNATIVSIDLPGGKFGGGYSGRRATLYRRFAEKDQQLHLLREDSHSPSTFEMAKRIFGGKPVDLLFIDGDHTYEGVRKDWELYSQLVRPGGMIVFHDIAGNYDDTQVKKLWDSIKSDYKYSEYAVHPNGLYGIGVLLKSNS